MRTLITEDDLIQALADAASYPVSIDPASPVITLTRTMAQTVRPYYNFQGNGLRVNAAGLGGRPAFTFVGAQAHFVEISGIKVTGGYPAYGVGNCFEFVAPSYNDLWNCSIHGLRAECFDGIAFYFKGIFESQCWDFMTNAGGHGVVIENGPGNTVCQMSFSDMQLSRLNGWGAIQRNGADQVAWYGVRCVCNGLGGILAQDAGIHLIDNLQIENSGECAVVVQPGQNWPGGEVRSLQVAGNGSWTRPGVPEAKPTRYGIRCPPGAVSHTGEAKLRGYNGNPIDLWAPGSTAAGVHQQQSSPKKVEPVHEKPTGVPKR